ncbi:hypothetical protein OAK19_03105 [Aureispira]|nr:hypothetical protein [Aureispira sp.]
MSWTINENSKTSTTEYFNATHTNIGAGAGDLVDSAFINVAGYVSGTINFVLNPSPSSGTWAAGSTLEISIIGGIGFGLTPPQEITFEVLPILVITSGDLNSTFSIEWDTPLEQVSLRINNATSTPTGIDISIENICMQTESQGGGVGHTTTSLGPLAFAAPPHTTLQYNDSGTFASTSQSGPPVIIVAYDKTANTNTGQLQLPNNTAALPILAFSDGSGTYDNGIFRADVNAVGFATGSNKIVGVYGTASGNFIKGLNVGIDSASPGGVNICGIRRLSNNSRNSWEDGWMGNSMQLVFTGSDFTNVNTAAPGAPPVPQGFAVASARGPGGTGFVMETTASGLGNQIIAVKLLPKGFRVQITRDTPVKVSTADQTPAAGVWGSPANSPIIRILTQDINLPTNPLSPIGAAQMVIWSPDGMNTELTAGTSVVGNGTISVVVLITIRTPFQIDWQSSLIGVIVPIERQ